MSEDRRSREAWNESYWRLVDKYDPEGEMNPALFLNILELLRGVVNDEVREAFMRGYASHRNDMESRRGV